MAFTQVNATRIAKRVVNRSFRLRDRYRQELGKLDPPEQWIVVQEVSKQIEQFTEKVVFAAQIKKEIIDAWTDEDYVAMDTTREDVLEVVKYVEVITPLQEYGILPHSRTYYCLLFSLYHMFIIFVISY